MSPVNKHQATARQASHEAPAAGSRDGQIRISFSALLRIKEDDQYVLFHTPSRPGAYGPPGGVIKYFAPAVRILEPLGFQEERRNARSKITESDLRGFLPARSIRGFLRWFCTGAYREDATECLHRELAEELGQAGLTRLTRDVSRLRFTPLRSIVEGPHEVPGKPFRQLRRFEVYDLLTSHSEALWLRDQLMEIGSDPQFTDVICTTRAGIMHGRHRTALLAPQTAFLVGSQRLAADLPPIL